MAQVRGYFDPLTAVAPALLPVTRDCVPMHYDQRALLTDLKAGRPRWGEAYRCCRERMFNAAARALRGSTRVGDPDEYVDEAFAEAMTYGVATVRTSLCSWLARMAHGLAVDAIRHLTAGDKYEPKVADLVPNEDVADVVELFVLVESLETAITELSEPEQIVIRERIMKKRPAKDVAAELPGEPQPQRVSQLAASALRKLSASPVSLTPSHSTKE